MLTLLSGFASHEREVIRERSVAGTNRVAESGAWMGGIVPYGYRKIGEKREAHLVISDDPIPGLELSEADVIRDVFRMAGIEGKSCRVIADRLNQLRVPCAYTRDDRLQLGGKRKRKTRGIWRPPRVRGLIMNTTYKGTHQFGKRSAVKREIISRPAPAIVSEDVWTKAQATLRANFLFGRRGAKNHYLLRGLARCATCGHTYVGASGKRPNGKREFYYKCNLANTPGIHGTSQRCPAKAVRGDELEQQVWSDILTFLRNPEGVLQQLQARLASESKGVDQMQKQVIRLEGLLAHKATERNRIVSLYRRGHLTDADLDTQMDEIGREQDGIESRLTELRAKLGGSDASALCSAEALLQALRKRLDEPISWELKRRLIEILVAGIRVETVEQHGVKQARIITTYRFAEPSQPMPLVLAQSYVTGKVVRIPVEPKTVGDHIRRRRLELKLLQKDVAERLGVCQPSVYNWESNRSQPDIRYMPAVIQFLGYNPLPSVEGFGAQLVQRRTALGLSQKEAAQRLGVDPGTLARWERGERKPEGRFLESVKQFVDAAKTEDSDVRRAG
jgi:site-specific DNA recombinase